MTYLPVTAVLHTNIEAGYTEHELVTFLLCLRVPLINNYIQVAKSHNFLTTKYQCMVCDEASFCRTLAHHSTALEPALSFHSVKLP